MFHYAGLSCILCFSVQNQVFYLTGIFGNFFFGGWILRFQKGISGGPVSVRMHSSCIIRRSDAISILSYDDCILSYDPLPHCSCGVCLHYSACLHTASNRNDVLAPWRSWSWTELNWTDLFSEKNTGCTGQEEMPLTYTLQKQKVQSKLEHE